jgi:hypothetical protein
VAERQTLSIQNRLPERACGFESHPGYPSRCVRPVRDTANVRSYRELAEVQGLVAKGANDCEIARLTAIPRSTVREWRSKRRWLSAPEDSCASCDASVHDFDRLPVSYVYLLGLYLGDGCLSSHRRGVFRLRVVLDSRYPGIVSDCAAAMQDLLPGNRPGLQPVHGENAVEVGIYSKQLPCLFPQHGPGRKHERVIHLADWQQRAVERHPQLLLRGLIHSDGCRFTNTVRHLSKTYEYARYNFSNRSADIRGIFCDTCDLLGIEWRVMNAWNISVARRASVARLDKFIGPKT